MYHICVLQSILIFTVFDTVSGKASLLENIKNIQSTISQYNQIVASGGQATANFFDTVAKGSPAFKDYLKNLNGAQASAKGYVAAQTSQIASTVLLTAKTALLNATISFFTSFIVSWGIKAAIEYANRLKDTADTSREVADSAKEASNSLSELVKDYQKLGDNSKWDSSDLEKAKGLQDDILELIKDQGIEIDGIAERLDLVNGKYSEQRKILAEITSETAKNNKGAFSGDIAAQGNLLSSRMRWPWQDASFSYGAGASFGRDTEFARYLNKNGYGTTSKGAFASSFSFGDFDFKNADEILRYYNLLDKAVNDLAATFGPAAIKASGFYNSLVKERDRLSDTANSYKAAIDAYQENDAIIKVADSLKTATVDSKESFETWKASLVDSSDGLDAFELKVLEVADTAFPEFKEAVEETNNAVVEATSILSKFTDSLYGDKKSGLQYDMDALDKAAKDLAESGTIAAGTFKELVNRDLLQYIEETTNGLIVNKGALLDLAEAKKVDAISDLQRAAAQDIYNLSVGDTDSLSSIAQTAISNLGGAMEGAGTQAVNAAGMVATFNSEVFKAAAAMGATINTADIQAKANAIVNSYKDIAKSIAAVSIDTDKYTGKTKSAGSAAKGASKGVDELTKSLKEEKQALQETKKELEKEEKLLKIYGQAATNALDKQIDALKDKKKALEDANDEEDRALKLAELQEALARAQSSRNVRTYTNNEGFTWQADKSAVSEAQNALDDQQRTWSREDAISAIDDEIEKLNELKDKYSEAMSLIGTSWEEYQAMLEAQAMFEGMTYGQMADYHTTYKDNILANMRQLQEVEDQLTETDKKLTEAQDNLSKSTGGGGGGGSGDSGADGLADKYERLRLKIYEAAEESKSLKDKEDELRETIKGLTVGTDEHYQAMLELDQAKQRTAESDERLAQLSANYIESLSLETQMAQTQKTETANALTDLLDNYDVNYGQIAEILDEYLNNLDLSVTTNEESFNTIKGVIEDFQTNAKSNLEATGTAMDGLTINIQTNVEKQLELLNKLSTTMTKIAENAKKAREALNGTDGLDFFGGRSIGSRTIDIPNLASGSRNRKRAGVVHVDEEGPELIQRNNGRYTILEQGDSVYPASYSANLWNFAKNPVEWFERQYNKFARGVNILSPAGASSSSVVNVNVGGITMNEVNDLDTFSRIIERNVHTVFAQAVSKKY